MTARKPASPAAGRGAEAALSILLLDEQRLTRDALQALLGAQPGLRVAGALADRASLAREATRLEPDVVLVAVAAFTRALADGIRELSQRSPAVPVVVVTARATLQLARASLEAGARGLLSRNCSGAELAKAVRAVAAGRRHIGEDFAAWTGEGTEGRAQRKATDRLTAAEYEIVRLVTEGKSNHQVASILGLSPRTVETYRLRLMRKLSVDSLPALVKYAIREGMTALD